MQMCDCHSMSRIPLVRRQAKTTNRLRKAGEQGLVAVYAYLVEDSHLSKVQLVEKAANYVADARWSGVVNESFKGQLTTHLLSCFRGLESANTLRMSEVFEALTTAPP